MANQMIIVGTEGQQKIKDLEIKPVRDNVTFISTDNNCCMFLSSH